TIYREQERYDDLLDVLDERRRRADDDMRATWSVLAARTLWEDLGRPGRAAERVDELLDDRPDHPGALRLGARIALDNEDWERAASHLERLVDREDAGLETREAERRLAELLSERLGRPEEARSRFESILERAPADRRALEGLGVALFQLQDWEAHVDALIRQIGVAAGNPEVVEDRDLDALDLDDLPASERGDVAPTAADAARIAEDHLGSPDLAIRLWQLVRELEPDHPEALERLVELHRRTDSHDRLVDALVARSDGLLDPDDRARSLVEAARVCIEELDEPGRARSLLDRTEELDGASESVRADLDKLRNRLDE
ncbi:MAG: tetratricopeptide repeat protein, partial [Bradymonadaceae bacterium]